MDWSNRVAIVTGASSGIGEAVTRALCGRGVRVAMVARSLGKLETLAWELNHESSGPPRVLCFALDVTDHEQLSELPLRVQRAFGRLDFVVNNAGVNHRGPLGEQSPEELLAIVQTNLIAPILLTRAALPLLRPGGIVFNVASLAGKVPVPDEATYSGTKAGLRAFARAVDSELRLSKRTVRVLTLCPGPVDTGFLGQDLSRVPDLVFSQPMSSAANVASKLLRLAESNEQERDMPGLSGKLATLSYLSPKIFSLLRPAFTRLGARKKVSFLARSRTRDGV